MHEAVDAVGEGDEDAEVGEVLHHALVDHADLEDLVDLLPGVGRELFQAERDLLRLMVDLEDLRLDLGADLHHVVRAVDVAPRHVGDVQEAVDAADVDERAIVGDRLHDALDDLSLLDVLEDLLRALAFEFLEELLARQDDVVPLLVELHDAELEFLVDVFFEVVFLAVRDEGAGDEAAQTLEQGLEAALDPLQHLRLDRAVALVGVDDLVPGHLLFGFALRQDHVAVLILRLHDHDVKLHADHGALGAGVELGSGEDAFRLVADVDVKVAPLDLHDTAVEDVAARERLVLGHPRHGRFHVRELVGLGARPRGLLRRLAGLGGVLLRVPLNRVAGLLVARYGHQFGTLHVLRHVFLHLPGIVCCGLRKESPAGTCNKARLTRSADAANPARRHRRLASSGSPGAGPRAAAETRPAEARAS